MNAHFYKYQALGNDMLVIDPATFELALTPARIRLLCHRHFGLGADGICYGPLPQADHPLTMRFFNPDGSESGKSGNGLRVFARYVWDNNHVAHDQLNFEIAIGREPVAVSLVEATARAISTTIGQLSFDSRQLPMTGPARQVIEEPFALADDSYLITGVSLGNPHCVIFRETISKAEICALGPLVETDSRFPQRTNVQLVRVVDRHTIEIEIWERGAGYTLASGSSASATAGAAITTGRCASPVEVRMAGGPAQVAVTEAGFVTLTGPVEAVAQGVCAADLLAKLP